MVWGGWEGGGERGFGWGGCWGCGGGCREEGRGFVGGPEDGVEGGPLVAALVGKIFDGGVGADDGGVLDHAGGHEALFVGLRTGFEHFGLEQVGAFDGAELGEEGFDLGGAYCWGSAFAFLGPADFDCSVDFGYAGSVCCCVVVVVVVGAHVICFGALL